jgi:hypothetical protein
LGSDGAFAERQPAEAVLQFMALQQRPMGMAAARGTCHRIAPAVEYVGLSAVPERGALRHGGVSDPSGNRTLGEAVNALPEAVTAKNGPRSAAAGFSFVDRSLPEFTRVTLQEVDDLVASRCIDRCDRSWW